MSADWFKQDTAEVLQRLKTDAERGLSAEEAAQRLESAGANELDEAEKRSTLRLFLEQFSNPLLIILLVGASVSLYADHVVDAIAIAAIVIINALISFAQEFKAQKSMDALKEMAAPDALARRAGGGFFVPTTSATFSERAASAQTGPARLPQQNLATGHAYAVSSSD